MNLDDESYLTAFLDGELDAEHRLQVESAIQSNPRLAEQLNELAALRDLVAGLSRPALRTDLAGTIVGRLALAPRRRLSLFFSARPWPALGLGLGAAAAVLLALTLGPRQQPPKVRPAAPKPERFVAEVSSPALPPIERGAASNALPASAETRLAFQHDLNPVPPRPATAIAADSTAKAAGKAEPISAPPPDHEQDREQIRALLDHPNLHRVFIVTDVLGGNARQRVNDLIQQTPRHESHYGQITIGQEIVIDPKHPNEATVFALALDDDELAKFQTKLNKEFSGLEEAEVDPVVVTQMGEIGQVAVLSSTPVAEVDIPSAPPAPVARRHATKDRVAPMEKNQVIIDPSDNDPFALAHARAMLTRPRQVQENAVPERERNRRATARGKSGPPSNVVAENPDGQDVPDRSGAGRSAIVLVWVTTRGSP